MAASHLVADAPADKNLSVWSHALDMKEANLGFNAPCSSITICTVLLEYVFRIQSIMKKQSATV